MRAPKEGVLENSTCATCGLTFPPLFLFSEEIVLRASDGPQLPPRVLAQEVICLDSSSGSEDEKSSRDGKIKPDVHRRVQSFMPMEGWL